MNNRVYVLCKKSVISSDKNEIVTFPVTTIVYLRKIDNTPCFPQKNSIMKQYVECWWNGLLCHFIFRPIFPVSMKAFHVPVGSEHQYLCFLSRLNAAFFGICDNSKCSVTDNERWEVLSLAACGKSGTEWKRGYRKRGWDWWSRLIWLPLNSLFEEFWGWNLEERNRETGGIC